MSTKKIFITIFCILNILFLSSCSINNKTDKVSFIAAGDTLIHGAIYRQANERSFDNTYDFEFTFENIEYYFKNFDIKFINQETLVNSKFKPSHYPKFSTPTEFGDRLVDMGFNVIGTSNNHMYDKGEDGVTSCIDYWNQKDVTTVGFYTGDDNIDIKYITHNNITMAFLAYTQQTNGLTVDISKVPHVIYLKEIEKIERQIKTAKENSDIVIVSCHWGEENTNEINSYQKEIANKLNILGADVIIGTHPHVIQPVEWLTNDVNDNKTLVCYSLGNFISAQHKANNMLGGLFQFDIVKEHKFDGSSEIKIENPYFVPIITHYETTASNNITNYLLSDYTPEIAANHGVSGFQDHFSYDYIHNIVNSVIDKEFIMD